MTLINMARHRSQGQENFKTADHTTYMREQRKEMSKRNALRSEEELADTLSGAPVQVARQLRQAKNMGAWMRVQPSTVNGMELGAQEWRYALFLGYGLDLPDLPKFCEGWNSTFFIWYALDYKKDSLVTEHHNELCNGVANLDRKSFTLTDMRDEPLIFTGRKV